MPGRMNATSSNLCDRVEPRQPLLAGQVAERVGAGMVKIEAKALKPAGRVSRVSSRPLLIDDGAARLSTAERRAGGASGMGRLAEVNIVVRHGHQMGNAPEKRKLRW